MGARHPRTRSACTGRCSPVALMSTPSTRTEGSVQSALWRHWRVLTCAPRFEVARPIESRRQNPCGSPLHSSAFWTCPRSMSPRWSSSREGCWSPCGFAGAGTGRGVHSTSRQLEHRPPAPHARPSLTACRLPFACVEQLHEVALGLVARPHPRRVRLEGVGLGGSAHQLLDVRYRFDYLVVRVVVLGAVRRSTSSSKIGMASSG